VRSTGADRGTCRSVQRRRRIIAAAVMVMLMSGCGGGISGVAPPPSTSEIVDGTTGPGGRLTITLRIVDIRLEITVQDESRRPLEGISVRAVADRNRIALLAWDSRHAYFPAIWTRPVAEARAAVEPVTVLISLLSVYAIGSAIREAITDPPDWIWALDIGGRKVCRRFEGDVGDLLIPLSLISIWGLASHLLNGAKWVVVLSTTTDSAALVAKLAGFTERRVSFNICNNELLSILGRPAVMTIEPIDFFYVSSGQGFGSGPSNLFVVARDRNGRDFLVGELQTPAGLRPPVTDLARRSDGAVFGISFDTLYQVDPLAPGLDSGRRLNFDGANSAAFNPIDDLYVGTAGGALYRVSPSTGVGTLVMALPEGMGFHGDLVFESRDVFVAAAFRSPSSDSILVRGNVATRTAAVVGAGVIGFQNVWGLGLRGETLYAVSANPATGRGVLLSIDRMTARGTFIRDLTFSAFGGTRR
jgi:hypothetical protein